MLRNEKGQFVSPRAGGVPTAPAKDGRGEKGGASWTKEKEKIFFRELTTLCNVSSALRKAGLGGQSRRVYDRRKQDPRFRIRWDEAIAESYALLELDMLERARFGKDRPEPGSEVEKRLRSVPDSLALQLLKLYQARAKGGPVRAEPRSEPPLTRARGLALRRELEAMLSDFNRRMGGEG